MNISTNLGYFTAILRAISQQTLDSKPDGFTFYQIFWLLECEIYIKILNAKLLVNVKKNIVYRLCHQLQVPYPVVYLMVLKFGRSVFYSQQAMFSLFIKIRWLWSMWNVSVMAGHFKYWLFSYQGRHNHHTVGIWSMNFGVIHQVVWSSFNYFSIYCQSYKDLILYDSQCFPTCYHMFMKLVASGESQSRSCVSNKKYLAHQPTSRASSPKSSIVLHYWVLVTLWQPRSGALKTNLPQAKPVNYSLELCFFPYRKRQDYVYVKWEYQSTLPRIEDCLRRENQVD